MVRGVKFRILELSGMGFSRNMGTAGRSTGTFKRVQAMNVDYRNTNYDRGHLNPNFYQCDVGRTATFTLTNAVPQDPCFNQNMWKEMETTSKDIMTELCSFAGARRYFVTGAVPGYKTIPSKSQDEEGDETREYNRVTVPSNMWTAACCDSSSAVNPGDRYKGFSFGYYGKNEPDAWVTPSDVSTMQDILGRMYNIQVFDIFADSCFEYSPNSKTAIKKLRVPLNKRVAESVLDLSKSSESSVPEPKRKFVQKVDDILNQNSAIVQRNWKFSDGDIGLQSTRNLTQNIRSQLLAFGLTTVLTRPKLELSSKDDESVYVRDKYNKLGSSDNAIDFSLGRKTGRKTSSKNKRYRHKFVKELFAKSDSDIRKQNENQAISGSNVKYSQEENNIKTEDLDDTPIDNYVVVPSLQNTWTGMGYRCRAGHSCDKHENKKYYWCYIDWKDNWDYCCVDDCDFRGKSYQWCNAGSEWAYCSLPYSTITISSKPCLQDHTCGMHKKNYFWCFTDLEGSWDYCCQPWHDCLYHNTTTKWCYTGYKKESRWDECHY